MAFEISKKELNENLEEVKQKAKKVAKIEENEVQITTIRVNKELYKEFKIHCANLDEKINDRIIELIKKDLMK